MKNVLLIIFLVPIIGFAQDLKFDKKYFECEDKWVAFPKGESESAYMYGFIYLDEQAGFTFNLEGQLQIEESGKYTAIPRDPTSNIGNVKLRLEPNTKLVAVIPEDKLSELNHSKEPDWLPVYKESEDPVRSLVARGFHYNHVGASSVAILYLEEAYKLDNNANGLEFELAYAYNATDQFKKALTVLEGAIKNDPKNYFFYREKGFALLKLDQLIEAEKTYTKGIEISDDAFQKSEMTVNMAQAYFNLEDKKNFKKWAKETRKYAEKDSKYMEYIKYWEGKLK